MAQASMLAGMAFANTGLGLAHGFAHPLGARHGLAHGVCCGRVLPHVLRYNAEVVPKRVVAIGIALFQQRSSDPMLTVELMEQFIRKTGIPAGLADLKLADEEIVAMAQDALLVGAVKTNPQVVTEEDSIKVLRAAAETK
jgi:alcohol dehydrogenase